MQEESTDSGESEKLGMRNESDDSSSSNEESSHEKEVDHVDVVFLLLFCLHISGSKKYFFC